MPQFRATLAPGSLGKARERQGTGGGTMPLGETYLFMEFGLRPADHPRDTALRLPYQIADARKPAADQHASQCPNAQSMPSQSAKRLAYRPIRPTVGGGLRITSLMSALGPENAAPLLGR